MDAAVTSGKIAFISEVDSFHWWKDTLEAVDNNLSVIHIDDVVDTDAIDFAVVWNPPSGLLAKFGNLKAIFSLGAGVDHILKDPAVPEDIPLVRVVDENLTMRMSEYIMLFCLSLTRQQEKLKAYQDQCEWCSDMPITASDVRVGIMGLGVLGSNAARRLTDIGFRVSGWSQSRKTLVGVNSYVGGDELEEFLNQTDILVSLLPATRETSGLINFDLLSQLPSESVLGKPCLISAGRGAVQIDNDILRALDSSILNHAVLDVFECEPLSQDSPLWVHPKVTVTPHCAAVTDPRGIALSIAKDISLLGRGHKLSNIVDIRKGY